MGTNKNGKKELTSKNAKKPTLNASKSLKYTEDGLRIYSSEELKIGKGGNTE